MPQRGRRAARPARSAAGWRRSSRRAPSVGQLARDHASTSTWVRVAQGVDGDAAEQVEVLTLPSASQTWAALAAGEHALRGAEGVHQRRRCSARVHPALPRSVAVTGPPLALAASSLCHRPAGPGCRRPSSVNSSRSIDVRQPAVDDVSRGSTPPSTALQAGAHLRDHARLRGSAACPRSASEADRADERGLRVRPVERRGPRRRSGSRSFAAPSAIGEGRGGGSPR